jgi:LCP family protein required for cell wall assembly
MDIVRRTKKNYPQNIQQPQRPQIQTIRSTRAEEIYITPEDMERMHKHERNFKFGTTIKKILFYCSLFIFSIVILYTGYFLWKGYAAGKKMNSEVQNKTTLAQDVRSLIAPIIPTKAVPLDGEKEGRINILLMGAAGQHNPGGNLTDTIMIMSIDSNNKKVALLSIPRDFYVNIPDLSADNPASTAGGPGTQNFTKINSLYQIGLKNGNGAELIKQAIEKITNIKIHYYLTVDFDGFKKIIDDIGGINVMVEKDIYDPRYPGPNYSYETFAISKGFHTLDGSTALKYVRERHNDAEGDFGRAKRQQQVIQSVKNKLFSMETVFNLTRLNDVLSTLGDNIKTNITFENIDSFIKLSKQIDTQNITNVVLDAWKPGSLLKVSHIQVGSIAAFILIPRVGNYSEIQDLAQNIFNLNELKRRKAEILSEDATIIIINQSGESSLDDKIKKLLVEKMEFKKVRIETDSSDIISNQTRIYDNTNGKALFTTDELIKKLPARIAEQSPTKKPAELSSNQSSSEENINSITVTLGKDLIEKYNFEEANIDDYNNAQDNQDNIDLTIK